MKRTLTAFALSDKETRLLRSYVTLMRGLTSVEWEYVDAGPVDLHVVRAAPEEGRRFLDKARGVCVAYGDPPDVDSSHIVMPTPMRTASLVKALNEASRRLERNPKPGADDDDRVSSAPLADVLRHLLSAGTPSAVIQGDRATLVVDFAARTVHASTVPDLARCAAPKWQVSEAAGGAPPGLPQYTLQRLLWIAGMADTRPPKGAYRLVRWPDFGALPHAASFPRLAAWFFHRQGPVAAAVEQTGLGAGEVASFLNATLLAGYASQAQDMPDRVPAKPGMFGGVVARIRRSLGL